MVTGENNIADLSIGCIKEYRESATSMKIRTPFKGLWCAALWVFLAAISAIDHSEAQSKKVRVAIPGYTIAVLSFLAAKMNGYYTAEGLDVELIAMRAPTANVAVLSGSVEFSGVPLSGLTTALRGAPLKVLFCQNDRPQHVLFAKPDLQNIRALRGKKIAVADPVSLTTYFCARFSAPTASTAEKTRRFWQWELQRRDSRRWQVALWTRLFSSRRSLLTRRKPVSKSSSPSKMKASYCRVAALWREMNCLRSDPVTVEKFVRTTLMGFLLTRDNRAAAIKVLSRSLKIEEPTAARIYDSARPTMTH